MKYWNSLTQLEEQVIRVGELKNLMNLVANGAETSSKQQLETGLFTLLGMIEDIDEKLYEQFSAVWAEIRDDGSDKEDDITINLSEDNMNMNWDFGSENTITLTPNGPADPWTGIVNDLTNYTSNK